MDSLEFDLHGLLLDQLAYTLSIDSDTTNEEVLRLIKRCPELLDDDIEGEKEKHVILMTKTLTQNISALASFAANTKCETYVNEILPILLNYLRYLPIFSFEPDLTWKEFSLPDQLSEKLISGLLKIATRFSQKRDKIFKDVCESLGKMANQLRCGNAEYICTVILPLLKGFFRAFQTSHLPWHCNDFESVAHQTQSLVNNDCLQEVGQIIDTLIQSLEPQHYYAKKFLSRYQHQGSPLSSNGIILDITTMMRNMLSRAIVASNHSDDSVTLMTFKEIWEVLVKSKANIHIPVTDYVKKALRKTYVMSLQYFTELTGLLNNLVAQGNDYPSSLYVREIMATSLDLAAIASIYLHEVDDELISKLTASLFNVPQTPDVKVQKSALDATTLLALNYPEAINMIQTIRHFHTRLCYNSSCLLSKGNESGSTMASDQMSIHSSVSGISRNEEQRQQMYENIVCAVTGVACILKDDNITTFSVSMLGQRLHNLTPTLDTLILEKFVDVALISSEKVFSEIVQKFEDISRQSLSPENKMVTTAVLKCQLDLASRLNSRPEFYGLYLLRILSLFVEKGVVIQQTVEKNGRFQVTSLAGEIGILLPVLKTLLSHDDFKAHMNASEELVSLFRNLWFHCVLYGFVSEETWMREWRDSLVIIAQKTPPLVREATNYLESDLEFNSVLRRGNSDQDLANVRSSLSSFLPNRASEIKYFSFAEITFLLSVYHIEIMRSQMGQCSFILRYFVNQGINTSKLVGCMEEIGNQVIEVFIRECSKRAIAHTINENLRNQVHDLMIATCHRLGKVSQLSIKHLDSLMSAFPSLLCDKKLLFLLLELIELVWQSCEAEYLNEYSPVYTFTSPKVGVSLDLPDDYNYRREILSRLCENSKKWITVAMTRAPSEIRGLLESYLAEFDPYQSDNSAHMGRSIAVEIGKAFSKADYNSVIFPRVPSAIIDNVSEFIKDYSARRQFYGQVAGANRWLASLNTEGQKQELSPVKISEEIIADQKQKIKASLAHLEKRIHEGSHISMKELNSTLHFAAGILISLPKADEEIIQYIVWIPIYIFTLESLKLATSIWTWIINEKSVAEKRIMIEIVNGWIWTVRQRKGLFSPLLNVKDPFVNRMLYAPSDKATRDKVYKSAKSLFGPHLIWLQFISGRFQAFRYRCKQLVDLYLRFFQITLDASGFISNHTLSREGRLQILICALKILQSNRMEASIEHEFRTRIFNSAFSWFSLSPRWAYGGNKRAMTTEYKLLIEVYRLVENDKVELTEVLSTAPKKYSHFSLSNTISISMSDKNREEIVNQTTKSKKLLLLFLESELSNLATWSNPLNIPDPTKENFVSVVESRLTEDNWKNNVRHAWWISSQLAVQMAFRFKQPFVQNELHKLLASNASDAVRVAEALPLLLGDKLNQNVLSQLKYLLYWASVPPITAITYFSSTYNNNPLILQYAMRALEYHPVDIVFFYIPQIVQALRYDTLGYVERFIMGAAKISQLFAHQIIWNMKANMYKDDECTIPDSLKPTLDRIIKHIVESLSGEDKEFYEREFAFFENVTSISGKLKPYIKKSKLEKKQKIDEEMAKIKVDVGVYLPSNPEGTVVDIDYKSGRPLQSHAKAPFMATFKIRKTRHDSEEVKETLIHSGPIDGDDDEDETIDVFQSAIFKVGDDCRQDVLALQLIAIFKNIFTSVGLDLYLFPYRVVATAPGCGVIDVIPNSISRDQLGREKVNSLYDYFVTTYGGVDSISFQKARNCFIQSVAAYSVVSFLLQIKDRHNGNIMLDNEGHIIHIDFGFILDIAPGGITFESSPFKLTTEMIQVMGGRADVQQFRWFSELCIKAYLASRPYAEQIIQCVALMLGSGLPCFKGETLKRLRDRFQLDRTERQAADFMILKINQSFENKRTVLYDSFQKATNGIPY
ncbi:phosphatidylinositol 4-kinase [Rhizophagus clarus]|uniref:1-phosphatidylinositol 4-kinase n=1 Tax=Rhizophagus clarus TaxID=94130 RepID=A0A8H3QVB2_9GLOM|nr:phosphatidylinositol 4-kinase [Rhizophagus clarus]